MLKGAFYGTKEAPLIVGGRYGLSSKDVTPGQLIAVFDEQKQSQKQALQ